jgi:drug/metabolite transporter (DMT)-like permease
MARMLAPASALTAPLGLLGLGGSTFNMASIAAVTSLGILGTGLAFFLMGSLVARVGSSRASFATYQIPVVAMALGVVFRGDHLHALSVAGIALVMAGALLASRKERRA